MDALPVQPQTVKGLDADEKRQGTVESAREADHDVLAVDGRQTRRKSRGLDRQNLLAAGVAVGEDTGDKRMRVDPPPKRTRRLRGGHRLRIQMDRPHLSHRVGGRSECVVCRPFEVQEANVHIRDRQLRSSFKTTSLSN